MAEEMTYSKAGVNIKREEMAIKGITGILQKTFKFRKGKIGEVLEGIGSFANLVDLGEYALAMCTDGVGSKVLVAQELEKYDTLGIDLVAMNVNDLICIGAEPVAMVDYLAVQAADPDIARDISLGIAEGARQAEIAIIGGETASLPEVICGLDNKGFDLAGTAIGVAKKDRIISGREIACGDVVLGFKSSGVHSNGLSLARKVLPRNMWLDILNPTRIYVKEALSLLEEYEIHGFAHITGGGFRNLLRITDLGFVLDDLPRPQLVFKTIQERGNISDKEMHQTFNMGVGFCAIVKEEDAVAILDKYAESWKVSRIGYVSEERCVRIKKEGGDIVLN